MNTDRLQEFLVLSRTLSFSKAAAQLYLSQSILTRHIQSLEAELGVTLLERTTHGAVLTEAGKILARQGPSLLEKCGNTLALLKLQDLPVRGRVQIACEVEISYAAYIRRGIALVPRYAKNMLPPETFIVGISDRSCRFNEYLYYHQRPENGAAKLFYEEFRNAYIRT